MRTIFVLAVMLMLACGSTTPPSGTGGGGGSMARCSTSNCAGCCDSNDVCQLGQSAGACGAGGNACLACGEGLTCSSGVCVASMGGGGGGGMMGSGGGGGSSGPKRVFVTSSSYTGNLKAAGGAASGLAGGDSLCNLSAQAASLGGTWVAWLSAGSTRAIDRVTSSGPWTLVGTTSPAVVFNNKANLATVPLRDIDRDENGRFILSNAWTGTSTGGGGSGDDCDGWTTTSRFGTVGRPTDRSVNWTAASSNACSISFSLICFEL